MIEIKYYTPDLEQKHIDFASKYWTKSRRKTPEYIYWKFRGSQGKELKSFILAIENEKVIGQLGIIPVDLKVDGEIYSSQWACDLMVEKEYRGKGVAKLLYDFAHQQKQITLGSDPSPAASKSMQAAGYKSIKSSYKFFFSSTVGDILKLKKIDYKIFNVTPNFFIYFYILYGKIRKKQFEITDKFEYLKIKSLADNNEFASIEHNNDFLNWRYEKFQPYYDGIKTYSNNKNSGFAGYYSDKTYYITDLKISSWITFFDIISQIIIQYRNDGLQNIRFCSNYNSHFNMLWLLGFIKFRTRGEVIFFTENIELSKKIATKTFYYTFSNSDENI